MIDRDTVERIRSIFLHHEPSVSIPVAARLLGLSKDELEAAIDAGDVETTSTRGGRVIDLRELAEQALHVWPIATIEEALGTEAATILPPGVRTRRFSARLPRYIIAALDRLAEENGETTESFVTRELHGLAYEQKERLAAVIGGFAEAIDWPLGDDVCQ